MNTRCLASQPLEPAVEEAARLLAGGEPVALPTETVYGLAADATRAEAALKIFETKERPFFDPLIVHLPDASWLARLTRIPPQDEALVRRLVEAFWPGPLTLVLPRTEAVPDVVSSGLPTVAVRQSAHPVFRAVVERCGFPLAAPSANRFGRISPTQAAHVVAELGGRIPLVVDGGACAHGVESTVAAVAGGKIEILRAGPVTREELTAFAEVTLPGALAKPVAPGQLQSHYAPRTPLQIAEQPQADAEAGLLAWREARPGFACVEVLSATGDLREAAARLFAALRLLDESGCARIVAEPVPEEGLGVAIMERLRKAAHKGGEG